MWYIQNRLCEVINGIGVESLLTRSCDLRIFKRRGLRASPVVCARIKDER